MAEGRGQATDGVRATARSLRAFGSHCHALESLEGSPDQIWYLSQNGYGENRQEALPFSREKLVVA